MAPIDKNTNTPEEKLRDTNISELQNSQDGDNHLLFLIELKSLKLEGLNLTAKRKFLWKLEQLPAADSFYEELFHSDDLLKLKSTLSRLEQSNSKQEHFIEVRLKTEDSWRPFWFKIRPYASYTQNKKNDSAQRFALCIGKEHTMAGDGDSENKNLTDQMLKESQHKYQNIINSTKQGYAGIDLLFNIQDKPFDFLFVETNPGLEKYLDISDPKGRTIKELIPQFANYWLDKYASVALTGNPEKFSYSEGHSKNFLNVFAFPIGDSTHRRVGIIFSNDSNIKDASGSLKGMNQTLEQEIEQRTDELRENSQLLQMVFNTTNEGLLVLEPIRNAQGQIEDFKYLRVNNVMKELQGIPQLEGKRYLDVNPHSADNGLLTTFVEIMNKGGYKDFEFLCQTQGLPSRWYRIRARKQHELLITSMEDITERKIEAENLRESIRFKKQLAETSPDLIMILDLYKEEVKYLNRDLSTRPGMRKGEVLGKKLSEIFSFVHPREREKLPEFHQSIVSGTNSQITNTEFRLRGANKEWEWHSAAGKIFKRNSQGKVSEYLILLRNIEEQKFTQKALLRAEKLSIKGEVARTFAHELRNPLASIGMATDILKKNLAENQGPQLENYLEIIRRSTKVLNLLVTDLLTSSNYTQALLQKTCLAQVLEETLNLAGDRIYLTGIKVVKDYKGPYFINADKEKLKIALLNIIINASEAMHPDQGILRLKIQKDDDWFNLKIKDNGHGMEKNQLAKLFDAFYTQKPDGIGVGMTSVKSILEEHDAEIRVSSTPKKGTQFELLFQCHKLLEKSLEH